MTPIYISGYDKNGGLNQYNKPFMQPDQAFTTLYNAYVFRDRVKKREGVQILGRLTRFLSAQSLGNTPAGVMTYNYNTVFSTLGIIGENPEIFPASSVPFKITIAAPDAATFTDNGNGTFTVTGAGSATGSYIDYATGLVVLAFTAPTTGGAAVTVDLAYFPSLPVMGIYQREVAGINQEQTIWFDTKYAYVHSGTDFVEAFNKQTWTGTDSDFFCCTNYRGSTPQNRLFFATNFVNSATNPMRYTDGSTWTNFKPAVDAVNFLVEARILIPYYGRLLALNTWEGTDYGGPAVNIFNRCRFSQIGDPTAVDAWRSDQFGKGGFIDAPVNEEIISAIFFKNTLIVGFERSTWQLRYVGEYGLPFIWERISSDFGCESSFSSLLFDDGVLFIGNRAITSSNAVTVKRIDLQVPDQVFGINNADDGVKRVVGIRDYNKEIVFWCFSDAQLGQKFPNKTILYNYRNNTYAIFRDNVTFFGIFQPPSGVTWDSLSTFWDDNSVLWDDDFLQENTEVIVAGNQQGFVFSYQAYEFNSSVSGFTGNGTNEDPTLSITAINTNAPASLEVKNHNLQTGEFVYITGAMFLSSSTFLPISTNINDTIYQVEKIDDDNFIILKWDGEDWVNNFTLTPASSYIYIGGGQLALFPKMQIATKDFNPFQQKGLQMKLSFIDFLTDTQNANFSVNLYMNSSLAFAGNMITGNQTIETNLPSPYYVPLSEYAWHRFFATLVGQYIRVELTYSDELMADITTQQTDIVLNSMILYTRPGGKLTF